MTPIAAGLFCDLPIINDWLCTSSNQTWVLFDAWQHNSLQCISILCEAVDHKAAASLVLLICRGAVSVATRPSLAHRCAHACLLQMWQATTSPLTRPTLSTWTTDE